MADKLAKLLAKLSKKQLAAIVLIIEKISTDDLSGLDVKSLKGKKNIYRVRAGQYRVIYSRSNSGKNNILHIAKRDDRTYKNL